MKAQNGICLLDRSPLLADSPFRVTTGPASTGTAAIVDALIRRLDAPVDLAVKQKTFTDQMIESTGP
jgi:hypothetical protein